MVEVKVHLTSLQSDGENRMTVKVEADGRMWEQDGILFLAYVSKSDKPEERLRQKIELWPGRTIVKTMGEQESRMTFRMGERLQADYRTPHGDIPIETLTRKHWVKKGAELGDLELMLDYTLYLMGSYLADYQMKIVVEKVK